MIPYFGQLISSKAPKIFHCDSISPCIVSFMSHMYVTQLLHLLIEHFEVLFLKTIQVNRKFNRLCHRKQGSQSAWSFDHSHPKIFDMNSGKGEKNGWRDQPRCSLLDLIPYQQLQYLLFPCCSMLRIRQLDILVSVLKTRKGSMWCTCFWEKSAKYCCQSR